MKRFVLLAAVVFMVGAPNRGRAENCGRQVLSFNAPLSLPLAALGGRRVFVQPLVVEPLAVRSYVLPLQTSLQPQQIVVQQRQRVAVVRRRAVVRSSRRRRPRVRSRLIIVR